MQARCLPAGRGIGWLLAGFYLFRRNPPLLTALTITYLMLVQGIVMLLPGIGPLLLPVVLPMLTLIVANGCRLVDEGRAPGKETLLRGIAGNGVPMLRLGLLQLAGAIVVMLIGFALGIGHEGDPLTTMPTEGGTPEEESAMLMALMQLMLLSLPLILAFWFAPFLTGWEGVPPLKALFFSTIASWRNWRALGMFAVGAIVIAGIVPGFILIAASKIAGVALPVAFVALRMVLVFLVAPVLTASIYVSYRDIFHSPIDTNA